MTGGEQRTADASRALDSPAVNDSTDSPIPDNSTHAYSLRSQTRVPNYPWCMHKPLEYTQQTASGVTGTEETQTDKRADKNGGYTGNT